MRKEKSYGIIPLQKTVDGWQVFLVQLHAGHWGFPKGHPELGETPYQTAIREFFEETGLTVRNLLSDSPIEESYIFTHGHEKISKTVAYFPAEVEGVVHLQQLEVAAGKWVGLSKAYEQLTYPQAKNICRKIQEFLSIH